MRVSSDQFSSVIGYLASFGSQGSTVVFTPQGAFVLASVDNRSAVGELLSYGEYLFQPKEPLQYRFAVNLSILKEIVKVMADQDIVYSVGNTSVFSCDHAQWRIPYRDLRQILDRPNVQPQAWIEWDGTFSDSLSSVMHFTTKSQDNSCLDCVMLYCQGTSNQIRRTKRSRNKNDSIQSGRTYLRMGKRRLVATDRATMAVHEETEIDPKVHCLGENGETNSQRTAECTLMIDRRHVQQILKTCESLSPVSIRVGLNRYSVQCGRRVATFGIRQGEIDSGWAKAYLSAQKSIPLGTVSIDRKNLDSVVRQATMVAEDQSTPLDKQPVNWLQLKGSPFGFVLSGANDRSRSEVVMEAVVDGEFGPIIFNDKYLNRLAAHWPTDDLTLSYTGEVQPIIVRSDSNRNLTAMFQPLRKIHGGPGNVGNNSTGECEAREPGREPNAVHGPDGAAYFRPVNAAQHF